MYLFKVSVYILIPLIFLIIKSVMPFSLNNGNNDMREKHFNQMAWPLMKHHDIWDDNTNEIEIKNIEQEQQQEEEEDEDKAIHYEEINYNKDNEVIQQAAVTNTTTTLNNYLKTNKKNYAKMKESRVLHLFPVAVDGECLSNDGRRRGTCFNPYECRAKGGTANGECSRGFGVCCIFLVDCNKTITNNMTYIVSPNFPSFMSENITSCNWTIKLMDKSDISQLRIDFYHFMLGQPNRRNGVCDGDRFRITGGLSRSFTLCGQNNGQHVYYDIGIPSTMQLPRQNQVPQVLYGNLRPLTYDDIYPGFNSSNSNRLITDLTISLEFTQRYLPSRLWEIRVTQIPFSQRAPPGCLQYFTGNEGIIQTFNFADNGRHLANQNYRICMRQEMNMCSIAYQPCDEQSFRIGPGLSMMSVSAAMPTQPISAINQMDDAGSSSSMMPPFTNMATMPLSSSSSSSSSSTMSSTLQSVINDAVSDMSTTSTATTPLQMNTSSSMDMSSTTTMATTAAMTSSSTSAAMTTTASMSTMSSTTAAPSADDPASASSSPSPASTTSAVISSTTSASSSTSSLSDDVEGSGDNSDGQNVRPVTPFRRPRPVGGGFDILGFLRDAFDFNSRSNFRKRQKRQFYTPCRDRLTMPCIIEDFIDNGMGPLPGCEPIHCGSQFCASGRWPCRVESTVTPFYIGIHFGDGRGKGSAEDNIGACLRYSQVQCI